MHIVVEICGIEIKGQNEVPPTIGSDLLSYGHP